MGPNSGENSPQFDLPPQPQEAGVEDARQQVHEVEKAGENQAGKQQPQLTAPAQTTTTTQQPSQLPVPQSTTDSNPVVTQKLTANDVDLIEKQWVHKTKDVINQTKDDPHKQKDEVSRIKADYVKKRFNKVIPADGEANRAGDAVAA